MTFRTVTLVLLMLGVVAIGRPSLAAEDGPNRGDRHKRMLEKYDANKDGKLDDAEKKVMKETWAKHNKKGDKHHAHDGDKKECGSAKHHKKGDKHHAHDGDRKGHDSAKQHKELRKRMLEKYDANKDGKLDDAEKKAMKKAFADCLVERLDKNDDGKLNVDEVPEQHRGRFGKTDTNDDGYVNSKELQVAMAKMHKQHKECPKKKCPAKDKGGNKDE